MSHAKKDEPAGHEAHKPEPAKHAAKVAAARAPASALKRYKVSLPYQPERVVKAADEAEAISQYNEACGVLATDHKHGVEELKA